MNLLDLFVKIGVKDEASENVGKIAHSLGDGIKTAATVGLKAIATFTAAGAAGVVALTKSAVEAYANYEQLIGGIETLFGTGGISLEEYAKQQGKSVKEVETQYKKLEKAQTTVLKNAAGAYKSAGLSQNKYMETITSFSASLIQSLDGDTEKTAAYADMAIIDMADNANKMGTSIEMIQNAYQGFAKQNYTMLDNLNTMGALAA